MCNRTDTLYPGSKEDNEDPEFRLFKKQAYHLSLKRILDPLRPAMSSPVVMRCPDGHFRRVIFSIGPFMADYPEQVYLAAIVQDWCPKYVTLPVLDWLGHFSNIRL